MRGKALTHEAGRVQSLDHRIAGRFDWKEGEMRSVAVAVKIATVTRGGEDDDDDDDDDDSPDRETIQFPGI